MLALFIQVDHLCHMLAYMIANICYVDFVKVSVITVTRAEE
jgi:hypothetical protein